MFVSIHHHHRRLQWLLYVLLALLAILLLADTASAQPGWRLRRMAGAAAAMRANIQAGFYPGPAAYLPLPPPAFFGPPLPGVLSGPATYVGYRGGAGYLARPQNGQGAYSANGSAPPAADPLDRAEGRFLDQPGRTAAARQGNVAGGAVPRRSNGPELRSPVGENLPPAEPLPAAPAEPVEPVQPARGAEF